MTNFCKVVNKVLDECDVVLEVLDARMPFETRNEELEKKAEIKGKKLVYVLNKCDLVSKKYSEKIKKKLKNSVFVSTKENHGLLKLKEAIMRSVNKRPVYVGVVGYPNTGKSSITNMLKGKAAAKTAQLAGFTKGVQKVKITKDLFLLDTPGVLDFKNDEDILVLMSAKTEKLKEPDLIAMKILKLFIDGYSEKLEQIYGVEVVDDEEELLDLIAIKLGKLVKGGKPDINAVSKRIISDWQIGKLNFL